AAQARKPDERVCRCFDEREAGRIIQCNKHGRHPEEFARLSRANVSKGGRKHRAIFHPSRRPLACASDLLRMTFLFVARSEASATAICSKIATPGVLANRNNDFSLSTQSDQ